MIQIKNLVKKYDNKLAVDNVTININKGEIYGFIGHNGAGKTTTIKSLMGILNFDSGKITVDGIDIRENPMEVKSKMAYIPDNPDLYEFMTGLQYLNFICDIFKVSKEDRKVRIEELASKFSIKDDLGSPIKSYSHGMKQKLAIIGAWVHDPIIVVMDEPFVGLDPSASHILKEMMRELCDKGGAIFFSTHVLEVAEKLCDKIAIIKSGKLITSGTVDEVRGNASLEETFLDLVK